MNFSTNRLIVIGLIVAAVLVFVLVVSGVIPGTRRDDPNAGVINGTLTIWGMGESQASFQTILSGFSRFKGLTVTYRDFPSAEEYETALLEALATGTGPDIFMIRNDMLPKYKNKLSPLLPTTLNPYRLSELFPKVVGKNFVGDGQIYALPLSLDTLALFYNRDLLAQHAAFAPATWDDLVALIPKLTTYGPGRLILSPAAAIGGSLKNMENAIGILYLLMAQNSAGKNTAGGPSLTSEESLQSIAFYTQFGNAGSAAYTWNNTLPNDLELFTEGKLPIWFGYASAIPEIKARSPFLDFRVVPVPQLKGATKKVSFPRYFGFGVSRQSPNQSLAWEFILELTTQPGNARTYSAQTGRPPALFQIMSDYKDNPELSVFTGQSFLADSWIVGNPLLSDAYVSRMIESVNGGSQTLEQAAQEAQGKITEMLERLNPGSQKTRP